MSAPLLRAEGIDTYYGRVQILHGLDLEIKKGEIVAIIGPNGAGKTTALKALFGLVPVKGGRVLFKGEDVSGAAPEDMVRRGVSFVPQGRSVFPSLTTHENLHMGGFILRDRNLVRQRAEQVYERFPRLGRRKHQTAGSLSGGEQQMLAMGRALMLEPDVLLLDEPSVGLAPRVVDEILEAIVDINEEGVAIALVEQNALLALETADTAYLLVMGKNRMQGPGQDLLRDPKVREIYLGGGVGDPDKMGADDNG